MGTGKYHNEKPKEDWDNRASRVPTWKIIRGAIQVHPGRGIGDSDVESIELGWELIGFIAKYFECNSAL